jgi:hypothetical protein
MEIMKANNKDDRSNSFKMNINSAFVKLTPYPNIKDVNPKVRTALKIKKTTPSVVLVIILDK